MVSAATAVEPMSPIAPESYKEPVRIVCVGDSITEGAGAAPGKSYPSQLQELLGNQWKVGNFGVSGRTLLKNGDFPYWKEPAYQNALTYKPDVVIIMLGTNDTKPQNWKFKSEFLTDYTALVRSFMALDSHPRIYVCRPCPVLGEGYFGITETHLTVAIRQINSLAAEMKLGVIDMHAALEKTPELLPDRVHPNTEGAAKMAEAAYTALTGKPTAAGQ